MSLRSSPRDVCAPLRDRLPNMILCLCVHTGCCASYAEMYVKPLTTYFEERLVHWCHESCKHTGGMTIAEYPETKESVGERRNRRRCSGVFIRLLPRMKPSWQASRCGCLYRSRTRSSHCRESTFDRNDYLPAVHVVRDRTVLCERDVRDVQMTEFDVCASYLFALFVTLPVNSASKTSTQIFYGVCWHSFR